MIRLILVAALSVGCGKGLTEGLQSDPELGEPLDLLEPEVGSSEDIPPMQELDEPPPAWLEYATCFSEAPHCADDAVCRLVDGDDRFRCHPTGAVADNDFCSADDECKSGLCHLSQCQTRCRNQADCRPPFHCTFDGDMQALACVAADCPNVCALETTFCSDEGTCRKSCSTQVDCQGDCRALLDDPGMNHCLATRRCEANELVVDEEGVSAVCIRIKMCDAADCPGGYSCTPMEDLKSGGGQGQVCARPAGLEL